MNIPQEILLFVAMMLGLVSVLFLTIGVTLLANGYVLEKVFRIITWVTISIAISCLVVNFVWVEFF